MISSTQSIFLLRHSLPFTLPSLWMTKDFCGFVKYGKSAVLWSLNFSQLLGVQVHSKHYEAEEKTRYSSTAQRNTYHSLTDKNMKRVFLWHAFKLDVTDCYVICFASELITQPASHPHVHTRVRDTCHTHGSSRNSPIHSMLLFQRYWPTDNNDLQSSSSQL